jgi:S1-C subfamily serine protease
MIFPPEETKIPVEPEAPAAPPPVEPSRNALRPLLAAGVLTLVLAAFGGAALSHALWPPTPSSSPSASSGAGNGSIFGGGFQPSQNGTGNGNGNGNGSLFGNGSAGNGSSSGTSASSPAAAAVLKKVAPGLVDINTTVSVGGVPGAAAGTGMIVTSGGEVITNNHVISGAITIKATDIGNGKTYTARVVGYDRTHDVAVLMLEGASGLQTVPLGDSSTVKVGASIVTLGNAGGVGGTPSVEGGSIDALGQSITASDPSVLGNSEQLRGLIQIDGDVQPGDSGGPLTSGGKVIGMDTAASVGFSFQTSSGAGFAIPINDVLTIASKILAGKASAAIHIGKTAIIGVYVAQDTVESVAGANCPAADANTAGTLVEGVVSGSPATGTGIGACDLPSGQPGHARLEGLLGRLPQRHDDARDRSTQLTHAPGGGGCCRCRVRALGTAHLPRHDHARDGSAEPTRPPVAVAAVGSAPCPDIFTPRPAPPVTVTQPDDRRG